MSTVDSDSDRDSIESINQYDTMGMPENDKESQHIQTVRNAIKDWKVREMGKNTMNANNTKGLASLRQYVANSARLFYDLNTYLTTEKNNEKNMNDSLYVQIVSAIGVPGALSFHLKTLLPHFLQRDLVELPFTVEPTVINSHAKKGNVVKTDFPDEE
jgi:hypothetical protein